LAGFRRRGSSFVGGAIEALVLAMVCLSPWAFGGVDPLGQFVLYAGVAGVLALWAVRMLLDGRLSWARCPVLLCLAALLLSGAFQLVPLPPGLLAWLAPGTARLYGQLLPETTEVLPLGTPAGDPLPPAGSTLSFAPGQTRVDLVRLVAVFLLFAAVRNNCASAAALRRLSIAAVVNGALLSFFALVQSFSSPPDTLYWGLRPGPGGFGPFLNKNNFAFYVNLCLGLGVGLLLSTGRTAPAGARSARGRVESGGFLSPGDLLGNPKALWVGFALVLMVTGVVFSMSRGGFLALVAASAVGLLVYLWRSGRSVRVGAVALVLLAALALGGWLGLDKVRVRLETLRGGKALQEGRLPLWSRMLASVEQFPVFGTGWGTFTDVEPLYRTDPEDVHYYTNAENEYLEGLVEGGVVRLALSVLAVGVVFRLGLRALGRYEGRRTGGLVLGALFAFTALAIESFGDFGLHIPAIVFLGTAICANLGALGGPGGAPAHARAPESAPGGADRPGVYSWRLWGLAHAAGAALLLALGGWLFYEGWRYQEAKRLRLQAFRLVKSPAARGHSLQLLEEVTRLAPESGRFQVDLATWHLNRYREGARELYRKVARAGLRQDEEARLARERLIPALQHFLRARQLDPLLPEPHRCLADCVRQFTRADPRVVYLERARLLAPYDPVLCYLVGLEYLDRQPERAWENWRQSLELSDLCLDPILQQSAARLGPEALLAKVLPDRPGSLFEAAGQLYPRPEDAPRRRVLLERALALLQARPGVLRAKDYHLLARIHVVLGRDAEALTAYRGALARDPRQAGWRLELAKLLYRQGRLQETREELGRVIQDQPANAEARQLLNTVRGELWKRK
jgi:O-antigen ligase/tetratricopeptide (TPR) repeat protein